MKYLIVTEPTPGTLTAAVNKWLEMGWKPLGAPIYSVEGDYNWSQAITQGYELKIIGSGYYPSGGGPR